MHVFDRVIGFLKDVSSNITSSTDKTDNPESIMSQQQYRSTGGAGVGGSYGPTSNNNANDSNNDAAGPESRIQGHAGDSSGIGRTSGGAGIGGSYAPLMMTDEAKKRMQSSSDVSSTEALPSTTNAAVASQHDQGSSRNEEGKALSSPACDLADSRSPASKAMKENMVPSGSNNSSISSSGYYTKLQSAAGEARRGEDKQMLQSKL